MNRWMEEFFVSLSFVSLSVSLKQENNESKFKMYLKKGKEKMDGVRGREESQGLKPDLEEMSLV